MKIFCIDMYAFPTNVVAIVEAESLEEAKDLAFNSYLAVQDKATRENIQASKLNEIKNSIGVRWSRSIEDDSRKSSVLEILRNYGDNR